jgi:hypothetical protein
LLVLWVLMKSGVNFGGDIWRGLNDRVRLVLVGAIVIKGLVDVGASFGIVCGVRSWSSEVHMYHIFEFIQHRRFDVELPI